MGEVSGLVGRPPPPKRARKRVVVGGGGTSARKLSSAERVRVRMEGGSSWSSFCTYDLISGNYGPTLWNAGTCANLSMPTTDIHSWTKYWTCFLSAFHPLCSSSSAIAIRAPSSKRLPTIPPAHHLSCTSPLSATIVAICDCRSVLL